MQVSSLCFWIGAYALVIGTVWFWVGQQSLAIACLLAAIASATVGLAIDLADWLQEGYDDFE